MTQEDMAHRLLPIQKERALSGAKEYFNGWISSSFNYKALCLYYKTKALSEVSWSVDYCNFISVLRCL